MNGRLISVSLTADSSHFAFSATSLSRCSAILSLRRSILCSLAKPNTSQSMMRRSKSSPPRKVSPRGRDDLEHAVADLEDRDVEGAAAEVVDRDLALDVLAEAVGQRRRGRLVDDADDVEAGDAAGVLGRLALAVVEVGGHGDHRLLRPSSPRYSSAISFISCRTYARDLGDREDLVAQHDAHVVVRTLDDAGTARSRATCCTGGEPHLRPMSRLAA